MTTDEAITELNEIVVEFCKQYEGHTVGEALNDMAKEDMVKLTSKLLAASHNILISRI